MGGDDPAALASLRGSPEALRVRCGLTGAASTSAGFGYSEGGSEFWLVCPGETWLGGGLENSVEKPAALVDVTIGGLWLPDASGVTGC